MKGDPYHTMKKILAVVIIIAVALVVWVVMARVVLRVQVEKDFTLNDLNGKPFVLNSVGGQPIILTFVLSRCPECKTEATNLNRMYNKYKNDKKLVVLGIAEDAEATDMVKNLEIVFPMVVDEHYRVATLYGVKKLPHVIFIDKKGKVVRNVIETVLDEATIEKYLQEIF